MGYRSDFLKVLAGEKPSQFPATEYMGFWQECHKEYDQKASTSDLFGYFEIGIHYPIIADFNPFPLYNEIILEETNHYIKKIDALGITCVIEKGTSAMPHYIDFPIKDRESYKKYILRLNVNSAERVQYLQDSIDFARERDGLTELTCRGVFAFLRDFIKFEDLMMMFYDNPELIREMVNNHADFVIQLWSKVFEKCIPDLVYLGEDMAYKNGSMISPAMIEEFIYPSWKKIIDFCKSKGVKNIILDSDGNTMDILPIATKAGFTATLPIERASEMDGEKVRELYPNLAIIGGVDKLKLAKGKREIEEEILKAVRLYKTGRYIPSCDHSVPPTVCFENYDYYIKRLKEEISKI